MSIAVKGWVEIYLARKDSAEKNEEEALTALMAAIFQTSQYMREVLEFPELKSYERENNLSELWRAASIKIRP